MITVHHLERSRSQRVLWMLEELGVMDQTAITLCKENALPLIVLNIHQQGAVLRAIRGERVGTLVS